MNFSPIFSDGKDLLPFFLVSVLFFCSFFTFLHGVLNTCTHIYTCIHTHLHCVATMSLSVRCAILCPHQMLYIAGVPGRIYLCVYYFIPHFVVAGCASVCSVYRKGYCCRCMYGCVLCLCAFVRACNGEQNKSSQHPKCELGHHNFPTFFINSCTHTHTSTHIEC